MRSRLAASLWKQSDVMKEGGEGHFDERCALDLSKANASAKEELRHGLAIERPSRSERSIRGVGRQWAMLAKTVEMAQQEGFVTRLLPDDPNAEALSQMLHIPSALRVGLDLVGIHQNGGTCERGAALLPTGDFLLGAA